MLFNSLEFAIFLPLVFGLYWFLLQGHLRMQNFLIVLASYLFYGYWDWRFLGLIIFSTVLDYTVGVLLDKTEDTYRRKLLLWVSIVVNLGFLGFFKYYNFFVNSFIDAFASLGIHLEGSTLKIILPVGISFYTFQTLSYTIDVYRKQLKPTKDFVAFAAFVSFFPQLVAGPIERASHLLPQFYVKRKFDVTKAKDGLRQILWGLFKKIVIADNFAKYANIIFNDSDSYNGATLWLGVICFGFQIYGDFSGYSDIAIGTARLFGFDLKQNFAFPYFSRDIAEFWRRWHISLSSWFRDYLYIPLGGSRGGLNMKIRNTFIIFVVSGFWHGANWTYLIWGALNAIYFLPLLLSKTNRVHTDLVAEGKWFPSWKEIGKILWTNILVLFAWAFFRAKNMEHALQYTSDMFLKIGEGLPEIWPQTEFILGISFLLVEWMGRSSKFGIEAIVRFPAWMRWSFYLGIIVLLFVFTGEEQQFIYFQF
ncbi:MAG: MBOAT family protein [Flavobacteriaceae bacterium]|nr:MBOAT family protein [Flavobacteriaceae bacterium]